MNKVEIKKRYLVNSYSFKTYNEAKKFADIIKDNYFDEYEQEEICLGIEEGLDVSWFAKEEFNNLQMFQIRVASKKD